MTIDKLIQTINAAGSPVGLSQCNGNTKWHAIAYRAPKGIYVATQAFGKTMQEALENLLKEMGQTLEPEQEEFDDLC